MGIKSVVHINYWKYWFQTEIDNYCEFYIKKLKLFLYLSVSNFHSFIIYFKKYILQKIVFLGCLQAIVTFMNQLASTHPVISIFLLHGVGVEEADDRAKFRLPVLFMNVTEQEQRHKHFQVMEVIQLPDAEGCPLQEEIQSTFWCIIHIRKRKVWIHLHCFCFFVWPCWPVLRTSPSHCLPASLELNAPAAETGEPFDDQPSSVPSRWRKRVVSCGRKKIAQ